MHIKNYPTLEELATLGTIWQPQKTLPSPSNTTSARLESNRLYIYDLAHRYRQNVLERLEEWLREATCNFKLVLESKNFQASLVSLANSELGGISCESFCNGNMWQYCLIEPEKLDLYQVLPISFGVTVSISGRLRPPEIDKVRYFNLGLYTSQPESLGELAITKFDFTDDSPEKPSKISRVWVR